MDVQVAEGVFAAIMTIAVMVWAVSLRKATQIGKPPSPEIDQWAPFSETDDQHPAEAPEFGTRTLRGTPETLSQSLVETLVKTSIPGSFTGLFEIVERSAERVKVSKTGPLICNQPTGMYFSEADFQFQRHGEDFTEVSYRIGFERLDRRMRRVALGIILGLGLPILLIVGTLIWFLVVRSNDPSIRWQVFQTLQVSHVLWPPFLFIYLQSSSRNHARTFISNLLMTLEFATPVGQPVTGTSRSF